MRNKHKTVIGIFNKWINFVCLISLVSYTWSGCHSSTSENTDKEQPAELVPRTASEFFQRGAVAYSHGDFESSISDFQTAIAMDSTVFEYWHKLADAQMDNLQSAQALRTMENASSQFPDHIWTRLKLAEFQYILKRFDASMKTVSKILEADPSHPEAYFMMGLNFRETGDRNRAINSFQTAVENDPDLIDAWIILGNLFDELDHPIAKQYLENAVSIDSANVQALHALAYYLQNHGDIDKAIECYKKINRIDYHYSDAYLNSGILFIELENADEAYNQFNKMVEVDRYNPLGYYYRALTSEALGNFDQARADIDQLLRLDRNFDHEKLKILQSYTN